jgi:hypothetical protein
LQFAVHFLFLRLFSSQKCSLNVVSDPNLKDHPAFDAFAPVLGSLPEAFAFAAAAIKSSSPLPEDDLNVCIFGKHVLAQPLLVQHLGTPSSGARVVWLGFDASISGAIQLQSWQQVTGSTYATHVPQSFTGPTIR